jgi:hypothetical protein
MPPARKKSEPALTPPATRSRAGAGAGTLTADAGLTEPAPISDEQLRAMVEGTGTATLAGPVLSPPGTDAAASTDAVAGVTGTWRSGMTVTAMWSINETRNAWMYVSGLGWRKLYNGKDGAFMALTALAGQARQTGHQIVFREEADGMVYEIYLW